MYIQRMIFSYLTIEDMMDIILVSKRWKDLFFSSRTEIDCEQDTENILKYIDMSCINRIPKIGLALLNPISFNPEIYNNINIKEICTNKDNFNFNKFKNLTTLALSGTHGPVFDNLPNLADLYLDHIIINDNVMDGICGLNLRELSIISAGIDTISHNITNLKNLEYLDLSHNNIMFMMHINELENLNILILDNNRLRKIPNISRLKHLKTVILSNNDIEDISDINDKFNENITTINISNNRYSYIPVIRYKLLVFIIGSYNLNDYENIFKITTLKHLSIKRSNLVHISKNIRYLSDLRYLNVIHNDITELPQELLGLKRLEIVRAMRNNIMNHNIINLLKDNNVTVTL